MTLAAEFQFYSIPERVPEPEVSRYSDGAITL